MPLESNILRKTARPTFAYFSKRRLCQYFFNIIDFKRMKMELNPEKNERTCIQGKEFPEEYFTLNKSLWLLAKFR